MVMEDQVTLWPKYEPYFNKLKIIGRDAKILPVSILNYFVYAVYVCFANVTSWVEFLNYFS